MADENAEYVGSSIQSSASELYEGMSVIDGTLTSILKTLKIRNDLLKEQNELLKRIVENSYLH